MAENTKTARKERKVNPVIEQYNQFIRGLELHQITLERVLAEHDLEMFTEPVKLHYKSEPSFEYVEENKILIVTSRTVVTGKVGRKNAIKIDCQFILAYSSPETPTESVFDLYTSRLLPLNIWPYVRELAHSMTVRMGLPPLTLPLTKP